LVGLTPPDGDQQALRRFLKVFDIESDEFSTSPPL
jgi:hypothetical protein